MMNNRIMNIKLLVVFSLLLFAFSAVLAAGTPDLIGAFFVKGKVGLKWQSVSDASEYKIYRKTADSEFTVIASTDKTNYFDTQLEGGAIYTYKIAAVVDGSEVDGTPKKVKLPLEIGGFSPPKEIVARVGASGISISLRWKAQKSAIAYNVLRSTTQGSGHELVGNISTNKFTDRDNLVAGETYYYVIVAMNEEFEESGPSEEVSVKFGLSEEEIKELEATESAIDLDSINVEFAFEVAVVEGDSLRNPTNLAINSKGDIYVTDKNNKRIICVDKDGNLKFTFGAFMENEERENPPDGAFLAPFAVAIGNDDLVYVSDIVTNEIQVFTPEGKFIKKIRVALEGEQKPLRANGIEILDDNRILCTDVGNHRILILDNDGNILKQFQGGETFVAHFPNGICSVDDNSFVHTNTIVGQIVVSNINTGEQILTFGGQGMVIGTFGRAAGVYVCEDGLIWVTDAMGSTIQAFNKAGEPKIVISGDNIKEENAKLAKPRGIVVKDGRIYIASELSHKLLAFDYTITKTE